VNPLISTAGLDEALGRTDATTPVVLDVRWRLGGPPGIDSYLEGHVPGAVYVDLERDLAGAPGEGGRHPLPDPDSLERALRRAGVCKGRAVVVYDDADGSVAARAWWLLRWAGHAEVAVLDGGFAAWVAQGMPVTAEVTRPRAGDIEIHPGRMPVLDADEAAALARDGVLLDARAGERYRGETEPIDPKAGHIPGARNAPFAAHVGADGRWRPAGELARHFADAGVATGVPVAAYCGSGVTATSVVLALEVAGRQEPAALYPGSWSQWSGDPSRPVATGSDPG